MPQSANGSSLLAKPTGIITDREGNTWTIADDRVMINGSIDWTTARVTALVYSSDGQVWQQNADGNWWAKSSPTSSWDPPYGSTDAPIPDAGAMTNTVGLSSLDAPLVDSQGNEWSIVNGQVAVNGVIDPTTGNVTELAYVNGQVWQENQDLLWWGKSSPTDSWTPQYGTATSPIQNEFHAWVGDTGSFYVPGNWTPSGIPQNGDTAFINAGTVTVNPGYGTGVDFSLHDSVLNFGTEGSYRLGQIGGDGTVYATMNRPNQEAVTISADGVSVSPGQQMTVSEFQHSAAVTLRGDSTLGSGSSLVIAQDGINHTAYAALINDGRMTLDHATLRVGTMTGNGSVDLTNGSTMQTDTGTSNLIMLESGHLEIGTYYSPGGDKVFQGLVSDFGSDSSLQFDSTQATLEVVKHYSPDAREMFFFNGSSVVADVRTYGGQSHLYAYNDPNAAIGGALVVTAHDTGHSIPIINV